MNHLYLRLAWSYLEPQAGKFNCSVIDNVINKWIAKGYSISFCITAEETNIVYATPEWVKKPGAKGAYFFVSLHKINPTTYGSFSYSFVTWIKNVGRGQNHM